MWKPISLYLWRGRILSWRRLGPGKLAGRGFWPTIMVVPRVEGRWYTIISDPRGGRADRAWPTRLAGHPRHPTLAAVTALLPTHLGGLRLRRARRRRTCAARRTWAGSARRSGGTWTRGVGPGLRGGDLWLGGAVIWGAVGGHCGAWSPRWRTYKWMCKILIININNNKF